MPADCRSLRCLRLLATLLERGTVGRLEASRQLGLSPRTISEDMKLVAQVAPVVVESHHRRRRWVLQPWLGGVRLQILDRISLLLGRELGSFLEGTALHEGPWARADILAEMPPRFSRNLNRKFRCHPEPYRVYKDRRADLDVLLDGLLRERRVSFGYVKAQERTAYQGVEPLTLVVYRRALYLLARKRSGELRRFAVDRMRGVERGPEFEYPESWNPDRELAGSFGVFSGGDPERVTLRFSPSAAPYVTCRHWHPTQRLRGRPGGGVDLVMHTSGRELVRLALEWGAECEVLEPEWLRQQVARELHRAASLYPPTPSEAARWKNHS